MSSLQAGSKQTKQLSSWLWDAWCICSVIGIWPRFIEPHLLTKKALTIFIKGLPKDLEGLKIFHFSDLHMHANGSSRVLKKIIASAAEFRPDIIAFSGDFICQAQCDAPGKLKDFLNAFPIAPYGNYAVLGNHDYDQCVTINEEGYYDLFNPSGSLISKGFKRLFSNIQVKGEMTAQTRGIGMNGILMDVIAQSTFELLHNQTKTVSVGKSAINICGLGEHMLGYCQPEIAFTNYQKQWPGILLAHNPDALNKLTAFPGNLVLMGHTHGGQINLPWFREKFIVLEKKEPYYGVHEQEDKTIIISRGVGSMMMFRWFAPPEVVLITLKGVPDE